jgi:hypothetical protein
VLHEQNRPPNHDADASNEPERRLDVLSREKVEALAAMRIPLNHAVRPCRSCR